LATQADVRPKPGGTTRTIRSLGHREVLTGEPGIQLEIAGLGVGYKFVRQPGRETLARPVGAQPVTNKLFVEAVEAVYSALGI
jgi:hypothetical protein